MLRSWRLFCVCRQRVLDPTVAEPVAEQIVAIAELPVAEPVADTRAEPVADTRAEPVADTRAEPVADTRAEPVADTRAEPVADTRAEPVADTIVEPIPEQSHEKQRDVELVVQPIVVVQPFE
jgi:hypothetical protein